MIIEWFGEGCFKITGTGGHFSLLTELPKRESGLSAPRFKTDVLLSIYSDLSETLFSSEKSDRFLITSPGEYEIKGVFINGYPLSFRDGVFKTAYFILMEEIKLGYLGEINKKEAKPEIIDLFGEVDILFVPIGAGEMLGPEEASDLINQIEPKIAIPMYYKIPNLKRRAKTLEEFSQVLGKKLEPQDKLLIKAKDLNFSETKIIPLKAL